MSLNTAIGKLVGRKPDYRMFEQDISLPLSNRYVGIEIEAENITVPHGVLNEELSYWEVKQDGSLRNNGAEFITPKVRGKDISLALMELTNKFKELGISPIFNARTGLHVHVDVRNISVRDLQSLVALYLLCEPYLFDNIRQERDLNNYCYPLYNNTSQLTLLGKLFGIEDANASRSIKEIAHSSIKYNAFNIKSILDKGTIEFRHHYGTCDPDIVLNWVRTILHLVRVCKNSPYTTIIGYVLAGGDIPALVKQWCPIISVNPNDQHLKELAMKSILTLALHSPNKLKEKS